MTNPAEKIRQVVEETAAVIYSELDAFENLAAAEEVTKYVARQVIDAVIEWLDCERLLSEKAYFDTEKYQPIENGYLSAFQDILPVLKEARTSITNSTHE